MKYWKVKNKEMEWQKGGRCRKERAGKGRHGERI